MIQQPDNIYSVSQLTRGIKYLLEDEYRDVTIHGEISNFTKHSSGHLYFTLKDANAQLSAVMFRGNTMNMFFTPREGMEVLCRGNISVYEPRGNYQILVREMHPKGEGALRVAFEKLKQQLHEEGLFDEDNKKEIPAYPQQVALITSGTGAAIRDMISVLRRKNPSVRVLMVPVLVQGSAAASEIANAIDMCNEYGSIDTIVVGRGGGSLEDLWAFNEEIVARAIFRSHIPVISAVGHEVDFTISDFVADARAATPSVAAEMLVVDRALALQDLRTISLTIDKLVRLKLEEKREKLSAAAHERVYMNVIGRIQHYMQRLDDLSGSLDKTTRYIFERAQHNIRLLESQLNAHDSRKILRKGYAILTDGEKVVSSVRHTEAGNNIAAELYDGSIDFLVLSTKDNDGKS